MVALLLILMILAAVFHPPLYILLPVTFVGYVMVSGKLTIKANLYVLLAVSTILVLAFFLIVHSIINPGEIYLYLKGFLRYFGFVCFALMVINLKEETFKKFFLYLGILFVLTIPFALIQLKTIGRFQGFFSHSNPFAYSIVFILYYFITFRPYSKKLRYLMMGLLLIALILTKTSGALIALLLVLANRFVISSHVTFRQKVLAFGVLALAIPGAFLFIPKLQVQLATTELLTDDFIQSHVRDFRPGGKGSLVWRVIYWLKIKQEFLHENVVQRIFGLGIDVFTKGYYPYKFMNKDPHNDFIKVFIEYGFLGISLFVLFLTQLFFVLRRSVGLIVLLLVPLFFDNTLVNFSTILLFITLAAYEYKFQVAKGP